MSTPKTHLALRNILHTYAPVTARDQTGWGKSMCGRGGYIGGDQNMSDFRVAYDAEPTCAVCKKLMPQFIMLRLKS